jgi:hypothetical protein
MASGGNLLIAHARHGIAAEIGDHVIDTEAGYTHEQKCPQDFPWPGFCKAAQTIEHFERSSFRV